MAILEGRGVSCDPCNVSTADSKNAAWRTVGREKRSGARACSVDELHLPGLSG